MNEKDLLAMIDKYRLPGRILPKCPRIFKFQYGVQESGDCWVFFVLTSLLNNCGFDLKKQEKSELYDYIRSKGFNPDNGGSLNVALGLFCERRNEVKRREKIIWLDYSLDTSLITKKKLSKREKLKKLRILFDAFSNGWGCGYSRVSGKDWKADASDGIIDESNFSKNSWHAVYLYYDALGKRLKEMGSRDPTKTYTFASYRDIETFLTNIERGNIGQHFYILAFDKNVSL